jgi:hypothetical protein
MKFEKTINLYALGVQERILSGAMKLQRGQWCRCGKSGKRCRYVGLLNSKVIWVTHWQGTSAKTQANFIGAVCAIQQRSNKNGS